MYKLLLAACVLMCSNGIISAQADNPFSFGFALTPKTNFVLPENDGLDEANNKVGWSTQVLVHYQRNAKWAFATGIKYNLDRFERVDYSIIFGSDIDPIQGIIDEQSSWTVIESNLHYLGVPVEGRYYFKTAQNRMYAKLGFEYFFKIGQQQTNVVYESGNPLTPFEGDLFDKTKDYGTKANLGVGWETSISEKSTLFVEPEVAYSTTVVNRPTTILGFNNNPYRFLDVGLRMGLRF